MALSPSLDPRGNVHDLLPGQALPQFDLEAEMAILGSVLFVNEGMHLLDGLQPEHFAEPTNGRIFQTIRDLVDKGRLADPVIVANAMADDPGLAGMGGVQYLCVLWDRGGPSAQAAEYAALVTDFANRRAILDLTAATAKSIRSGGQTTPALEELETGLLALQRGSRKVALISAATAIQDMLDDLSMPDGDDGGVLTGLEKLDEHLGPLQPDELILIAGRPGMGKSALASCIALNIAKSGLGVIEINSEMSTRQMMRRHASDLCQWRFKSGAPTYKDIKRRRLTGEQMGQVRWAAEQISKMPLAMVKRTGLTLSSLRSLVRRQAAIWATQGITLGAITVDHVGLLQADGGGRDRYTDQTNIAIGMKALADELHIPVIALVQLSRKVEDREHKRPLLSDLRDSGAWEENADTVIGTFREAYYANKEPEPKLLGTGDRWNDWDRRRKSKAVEAILLKVREGEEAVIELWASIGHNAIRSEDPDKGGMF